MWETKRKLNSHQSSTILIFFFCLLFFPPHDMPYLLNFISTIQHQSCLNLLSQEQKDECVSIPFDGIRDSIASYYNKIAGGSTEEYNREGAIHPNDSIDLIGISGSGKTWIMTQIAQHTITVTDNHIIYIDLDGRFNHNILIDDRFHLFQPDSQSISTLILGLEFWLEEHSEVNVSWLMVDGFSLLDSQLIHHIQYLQSKWSFVLLTSSTTTMTNSIWNYRFEFNNQHQMKLIWPMHSGYFSP
ncbi:hypothetical protein BDB01DRAFT_418712 [Pilobolus umbonatus]|nr:hypothetical protein BDB01DRAFT_418712 [Pilobolus umbonatus]